MRAGTTEYWRHTRRLTLFLLLIWFVVTLSTCFYASELNAFSFMGFPVGFYFAAQGSLIVFLLIVGFYAWYMNRLDQRTRDAAGPDQR
jgi:putative solute:sodium symporter small subunit